MSRLKEIKGEIKALKLERELLRNKKTEHPLIVEARKRGFYEGMKEHFICLIDNRQWDCRDEFNIRNDGGLGLGSNLIMKKGIWTKIIKTK
jgi:hypothetical protein